MKVKSKNKKIRKTLLFNFILLMDSLVYALPDSPIEPIENGKFDEHVIVGGNIEKDKCFDYLGESETELGKFKKITNFLGCNSIPVPLSYCKCLKNLGGKIPTLVR